MGMFPAGSWAVKKTRVDDERGEQFIVFVVDPALVDHAGYMWSGGDREMTTDEVTDFLGELGLSPVAIAGGMKKARDQFAAETTS
jgi:hypothetical protein